MISVRKKLVVSKACVMTYLANMFKVNGTTNLDVTQHNYSLNAQRNRLRDDNTRQNDFVK
jgi:hypothetical protein